jgi:anti-sigma regulatory factor (Ser/Thr protein kinase)
MDLIPRRPLEFEIRSSPAHLPIVRAAIEKMCEMLGFDADAAGGVVLSVDEALTNIIKHAYGGNNDQVIQIELTPIGDPEPGSLRISLRDFGRQADPEKIKSRSLDDVRPGGLGVHIMNQCMDSVEFTPRPEGGTLLTMTKRIKPAEAPEKKEVSP